MKKVWMSVFLTGFAVIATPMKGEGILEKFQKWIGALGENAQQYINGSVYLDGDSGRITILENGPGCVIRLYSIDDWENRESYVLGKAGSIGGDYTPLLKPGSLVLMRQCFIEKMQSWVIEVREGTGGTLLRISDPVSFAQSKMVAEHGMDGRLDIVIYVPFLTSCQTSKDQEIAAVAA